MINPYSPPLEDVAAESAHRLVDRWRTGRGGRRVALGFAIASLAGTAAVVPGAAFALPLAFGMITLGAFDLWRGLGEGPEANLAGLAFVFLIVGATLPLLSILGQPGLGAGAVASLIGAGFAWLALALVSPRRRLAVLLLVGVLAIAAALSTVRWVVLGVAWAPLGLVLGIAGLAANSGRFGPGPWDLWPVLGLGTLYCAAWVTAFALFLGMGGAF